MANRWTLRASRFAEAARHNVARYGIKAGIVVLGTIVAAGTLHRSHYLSQTPLVARVAAADTGATRKMGALLGVASGATASAGANRGGLDAGVQHERIDYWVKRLSTTMADGFAKTLGKKDKYSDMITSKLAAKQMPTDLVYLAMIESEFNPNAKSRVKAVGLWQFMSSTARQFGLTVRGGVDERRDPARATDAAITYLSDLHTRLGSWYLAAAAYNSGEGTVIRALKKVTGKSTGTDDDFFRILPLLPKETQDYVPKLIATARIGNSPEKYGIGTPKSAADTTAALAASLAAAAARDSAAKTAPAPVAAPPVVAAVAPDTTKSVTKAGTSSAAKKSASATKKSTATKKSATKKKAATAKAKTKAKVSRSQHQRARPTQSHKTAAAPHGHKPVKK